jgi:hypothetical protein
MAVYGDVSVEIRNTPLEYTFRLETVDSHTTSPSSLPSAFWVMMGSVHSVMTGYEGIFGPHMAGVA